MGRGIFDTAILDFDRRNLRYFTVDDNESVSMSARESQLQDICDWVKEHPGCTMSALAKGVGRDKKAVAKDTNELIAAGRLRNAAPEAHQWQLFAI